MPLVMSRTSRRGPWLPEEDATLLHLVRTQGPNNWVRISQHMQQRSPKQCRERYHQNLKPSLNHEPITAQEGEMIEQLVQEMGKRWAEIARRLGNRSDNAVKNWWNGSMNRRKRSTVQQPSSTKGVGFRSRPIPASASPRPYRYDDSPHLRETYGPAYSFPPAFQRHESASSLPILAESPLRPDFPDATYSSRPFSNGMGYAKSSSFPPMERLAPVSRESRAHHNCDSLPSPLLHDPLPSLRQLEGANIQLPPLQYLERPIPSPAATEASNISSNQQAPSLISDNQSNCSISPKTIPSPRPGLHTAEKSSAQLWDNSSRAETFNTYSLHGSARPLSPYEPTSTNKKAETREGSLSPDHTKNKDNRMTLSRLLD